jgi:hypothetical protein
VRIGLESLPAVPGAALCRLTLTGCVVRVVAPKVAKESVLRTHW